MERPDDPFLGKRIRGYYLEELLGRGTLTAIYHGRTEELWLVPELMITLLLVPQTLSDQTRAHFRTRFNHQARQFALLRHPHLFPLYGYGEQDDLFYLLNPIMEGVTLAHYLQQKRKWSAPEILSILRPLATLFDYLYSQELTHPFFSPTNVLIQEDGAVLLTGLGLTQLVSMKGLGNERVNLARYEHLRSIAGTFLGAPEYLAPELVRGADADIRSAVYTFGTLLFEMLSGTPPFTGDNYIEVAQKHVREPLPSLHKLAPDSPVALELVVNRALQRNPERRFQSLEECITAYEHVIDERLNAPKPANLVQAIERIKAHPLLTAPSLYPILPSPQNEQVMQLASPQEPADDKPTGPSILAIAASQGGGTHAISDEIFWTEETALLFEEPISLPAPFSSSQEQQEDAWLNDMSIYRMNPAAQASKTPAPTQQVDQAAPTQQIAESSPTQQDDKASLVQQIADATPALQDDEAGLAQPIADPTPTQQDDQADLAQPITDPTPTQQDDQPANPAAPTQAIDQPVRTKMAEMVSQIQQMKERLQSQSNMSSAKSPSKEKITEEIVYQDMIPRVKEAQNSRVV